MKPNWKKIIELVIALLTVLGSFIGGQAMARSGHVDLFDKCKIENSK